MIPLDDVGIQAEPERHTCLPHTREAAKMLGIPFAKPHCDPCHIDGLLIRYSEALLIGGCHDTSGFDVVMRSARDRTLCYCGCGSHGGE